MVRKDKAMKTMEVTKDFRRAFKSASQNLARSRSSSILSRVNSRQKRLSYALMKSRSTKLKKSTEHYSTQHLTKLPLWRQGSHKEIYLRRERDSKLASIKVLAAFSCLEESGCILYLAWRTLTKTTWNSLNMTGVIFIVFQGLARMQINQTKLLSKRARLKTAEVA